MVKRVQSSVLLYGKSKYFHLFERELSSLYGFPIVLLDPANPGAMRKLSKQKARLLVYDKESVNDEVVSAFLKKNPYAPVVGLGSDAEPDIEITYREYSRIETSGLPHMLQVLEEQWGAV